jgi:hypothetical protein
METVLRDIRTSSGNIRSPILQLAVLLPLRGLFIDAIATLVLGRLPTYSF